MSAVEEADQHNTRLVCVAEQIWDLTRAQAQTLTFITHKLLSDFYKPRFLDHHKATEAEENSLFPC